MTDTSIIQVASVNGGLPKLEDQKISDEIETLCKTLATTQKSPEAILGEFNWITEYVVGIGENRPRFDGFKQGIGLEHEAREQMNVRSHLLWMEAAYQKGKSEDGAETFYTGIDMGIFIIPTETRGASVDRTKSELKDEIFTRHFPIECPIVLIEYDR